MGRRDVKGVGGGMLGKDWKELILYGLIGFWMVLGPMLGEVGSYDIVWYCILTGYFIRTFLLLYLYLPRLYLRLYLRLLRLLLAVQILVGRAGPPPRAPDPSGYCRTSTASSRSQWALPDLNSNFQVAVDIAGPHVNRDFQITVGTAGP